MAVLTYYISATGSNSNDGSIANPWLTIDHAMQNADWSSADGIVFSLAGTFTLTAPIRETEINANGAVTVTICAATLGDAKIIHNHTGILVGNWAYRRILWKRMEIEFANTGSFSRQTFFDSSRLIFSRASATVYSLGGNHTWRNCEIVASNEEVISFIFTASCFFLDCVFIGFRLLSFAGGQSISIALMRSRFVRVGTGNQTAIFFFGPQNLNESQSSIIQHCAFFECGSAASGSVASINNGTIVRDCVVSNNLSSVPFLSSVSKVRDFTGNYHQGTGSLGTPIVIGDNSNGSLTNAPYADPINGDWTVSNELSALATSEGLTPGPVQSTGGGASFPPIGPGGLVY